MMDQTQTYMVTRSRTHFKNVSVNNIIKMEVLITRISLGFHVQILKILIFFGKRNRNILMKIIISNYNTKISKYP